MSENKDQEIKNHEYDGIKEYNNPLPLWWLVTFAGTVIFAAIYYVHYELNGGVNQYQELSTALEKIDHLKAETKKSAPVETEEDLQKVMAAQSVLDVGSKVYTATCSACHGQQLQGLIGPNLTDKYWLHGKGTRMDIIGVVRKGVLDKGMPAWEEALKADEVIAVTAYVHSKLGSNPANPKAPQGEAVE